MVPGSTNPQAAAKFPLRGLLALPTSRQMNPPELAVARRLADSEPPLLVTASTRRLRGLVAALRFLRPDWTVVALPPWDCLPYDRNGPSAARAGERAAALSLLSRANGPVAMVATVSAALQRLPPLPPFAAGGLPLRIGGWLDEELLTGWLERNGYSLLALADEPGEAALRGDLVDLFPPTADRPLRLRLEGGTIAGIEHYDPLTQRSLGAVEQPLHLPPGSELPFGEAERARFLAGYTETFGAAAAGDHLYRRVAEAGRPNGIEHWLPLFLDRMTTVFDLLPRAPVLLEPDCDDAARTLLDDISAGFEARRAALSPGDVRPYRPLPPDRLHLTGDAWRRATAEAQRLTVDAAPPVPDKPLLAAASSPGQAQRLRRRFERRRKTVVAVSDWPAAQTLPVDQIALAVLPVEQGADLGQRRVVTGAELLGEAGGPVIRSPTQLNQEVAGLVMGDLAVHLDHGVGLCEGLEAVEDHDCLRLLYHGDKRVLVPVENLDLVWRLGPASPDQALDRIGGTAWHKRLARAQAEAAAVARGLIDAEAERTRQAVPVIEAPADYGRFIRRFPHVETPDQARAIEAVLADLAAGKPMDRLICGDVGFGKTEVALRAAFVVARAGRQVAVVAPTTPLCRQHFTEFSARFAGFGLRVAELSRNLSPAETRTVRAGLSDGLIAVVVGTQAVLSSELADLGLLVLDEEQRLGVRQKEELRASHPGLHMLALSATPIPRSLQQALVGLRDVSLIATAPATRRPVRTEVLPHDPVVLGQAVGRELRRGGQCFYVCPRIEDLDEAEARIRQAAPEASVVTAHAKMRPNQLDQAMADFVDGRADILLSTNIVETGLNIPNANTLFVHRADLFGLAQLHQLRGRVGRGGRSAWAYLLLEPGEEPTEAARERLEVLRQLNDPGAGFLLASRDRDLRGSGSLLGQQQAGKATDVGPELLEEILRIELLRARGAPDPDRFEPKLSLASRVAIPPDYIADENLRLNLYRRIAAAEDAEALGAELHDRFGPPPPELDALLALSTTRRVARRLRITQVTAGPKGIVLVFEGPAPEIEGCERKDEHKLLLTGEFEDEALRIQALLDLLDRL